MTKTAFSTLPLYSANAVYIAELYEQYLNNPGTVSDDWQEYFASFSGDADAVRNVTGPSWTRERSQVVGYAPPVLERRKSVGGRRAQDKIKSTEQQASMDAIHAHMLIRAFRVRGHLIANLDPLGLAVRQSHPELDPARYGFTEKEYDREIFLGGWLGLEKATLRQILDILRQTYSSSIGLEYVHIQSLEKKEWLETKLESSRSRPSLSKEERIEILKKLVETEGFEQFLHVKYPGTKRFSIEGAESLMPALEAVLETGAGMGVKEIVVGMPHRGRLNVLTAFMGKPYDAMLSEFQGNLATPDYINTSGDVKYHLGKSSDRVAKNGQKVHLSLNANPSHLEAVNPVVVGKVRAKQDQHGDTDRSKVVGILLHGDAAFCGQGIVMETLAFSELPGYRAGGTVHIIVNNQIGFTTSPKDAHVSPYPTDVAMMVQSPIFHVNGDDPEAVVHAARIATEYRQTFKQDVFLDIFCYRRHGHNEGDEPMFTQPLMYEKIRQHPTPREVYARRLIAEGVITQEEYEAMKNDFHQFMETQMESAMDYKPEKADWLEGKWQGIRQAEQGVKPSVETGVKLKKLQALGSKLCEVPEGFTLNNKVKRLLEQRRAMVNGEEGLDWAMGEHLAFASILDDGYPIRISGQDVIRATFSQRHAGLFDQKTNEVHFPLNHLKEGQKRIEALNSNLSEYAVLGFEYGYSTTEPNALVLWEAQFGDFSNGAQIMIDQFIASAEVKWLRMSGLVMLLPHGYEGQGPEHSSARLERYLQLCAEDNLQVANCTTPANYFHILRRQMCRDFRKPLVMMTPKSLLRHKLAKSDIKELDAGTEFQKVILETGKLVADSKVRKLVICSGKVYYDLLEAREEKKINDVALIRLEQFYPFPEAELAEQIKKYKNAEIIWCQEEPQNMGGWYFVDRRLEGAIRKAGNKTARPEYVGRPEAASPAAGYMRIHTKEQTALVNEALK
ncbi:MAG: 2-oxoglutarate dehydrogenase E1 component [Hyphomicrobiales bacterium]|nr:2-oxoglutarate dehydrogenase E1 component [Hyphomicrobiales bacterium]